MANFNKVLLMGNLTRDPELSYLPSQTAVADFGLAVNRQWTGQDGAKREETCFVDCRAFGKPAETIKKYLAKGRPVFVEGRLTYDTWTGQDGVKKSRLRVTVENFQFLGGPPSGSGGRGAVQPAQGQSDSKGYAGGSAEGVGVPSGEPGAAPEDEIPF
ncbi:MAG: single-stranded DNA-binding protein [Phycisphaerae bacterium]|nr:single-stranded DNA-binding protein [Phycisphaerae bacterium]